MAIARNPIRNRKTGTGDKEAEQFIRGNNGGAPPRELKPILINFEISLLDRIDAAARDAGLNRSAFVVSAVSDKLRQLERE